MGGTIRSTLNLAGALAERHEVEILSVVRLRTRSAFDFPHGVAVIAVDDRCARRGPRCARAAHLLGRLPSLLVHPADGLWQQCSLWTDVQLVRALWRSSADVLIATRPSLTLIAAELAPARMRTVGQEHLSLAARKPRMRRALEARIARLDAVVTLTERDRTAYGAIAGVGPRVLTIPNAATPLRGAPASLGNPVIVTAGRLTHQKGHARLVRAFAPVARSHPEWTLRICGSGPRRKPLRTLIAELGLQERVLLLGSVDDMGLELSQASIFALSSRFEGFPMVLLEAMSKGLPIVSMDCPTGPRELIDHGRDGILVPADDVEGLSAGLLELVENSDKRRRLGAAALEKATTYELGAIAARWETLLAELCSPG